MLAPGSINPLQQPRGLLVLKVIPVLVLVVKNDKVKLVVSIKLRHCASVPLEAEKRQFQAGSQQQAGPACEDQDRRSTGRWQRALWHRLGAVRGLSRTRTDRYFRPADRW